MHIFASDSKGNNLRRVAGVAQDTDKTVYFDALNAGVSALPLSYNRHAPVEILKAKIFNDRIEQAGHFTHDTLGTGSLDYDLRKLVTHARYNGDAEGRIPPPRCQTEIAMYRGAINGIVDITAWNVFDLGLGLGGVVAGIVGGVAALFGAPILGAAAVVVGLALGIIGIFRLLSTF